MAGGCEVDVLTDPFGVMTAQGFFESCYRGGFAESENEPGDGPVLNETQRSWDKTGESEINLRMEDPNISRAAFE